MTITGNYDTARRNRKAVMILTGDAFGCTDLIAGGKEDAAGRLHADPVERRPGISLLPHFPMTGQFQVMLAGSGMLGCKRRPATLTVGFPRAKTGYGGLTYRMLRPRLEYGGHYLADPSTPVDRHAPKFQLTGSLETADADPSRREDGLQNTPAPRVAGCFHVIGEGSFRVVAEELPPRSCIRVGAGEADPPLKAGPCGAKLLTPQFPDYSLDQPPLPGRAA